MQALRASSSSSGTLPKGARWDGLPALSSSNLALPPVPTSTSTPGDGLDFGECIICDSDDDIPTTAIIARLGPDVGQDPLLTAMLVFKVVHCRPGRLKRPLGAEDDVSQNDIAFRVYTVVERQIGDIMRIRVTRAPGSDVYLCYH